MESRNSYIEKMKSQLDNLNFQLRDIEVAAAEIQKEGLAHYQAEAAKIKEKSREAQEKFEHLKASTEDSWKQMVSETEKYRDAFISSFDYFKAQVK